MAYTFQGRSVEEVKLQLIASEQLPNNHHVDLGDDFKVVENLVWIKSNSLYWEALNDIKEQQRSLSEKIKENQRRTAEVTNELYNLIGFYSVFQGVILTAVTQLTQSTTAPRPLCGKVWFPLVLSGLAALAAVVGITRKHLVFHKLDNDLHRFRQKQKDSIKREKKLRKDGKNFSFIENNIREPSALQSYVFLNAFLSILFVVVVTLFFAMSYFVIMCDKWVIPNWD